MRVVHMSPTVFGDGGLFGGGERYPGARARLSRYVDCQLVTFGTDSSSVNHARDAPVRVLKPVAHLWGHPAHPFRWNYWNHWRGLTSSTPTTFGVRRAGSLLSQGHSDDRGL